MADTETERTITLLKDLESRAGSACPSCGTPLCGHVVVMSWVLGFKNAPRCWTCLAVALNLGKEAMRESAEAYIQQRECFRTGWEWSDRREGVAPGRPSPCLHPSPVSDAEWNAGDMGCGDLVLELRMRLQAMKPDQVIHVTARDPGAPEDMPAWCNMTGHTMMAARHPEYWIKKRNT